MTCDPNVNPEALDALEALFTNKSAALADHFYAVREREGRGWDGPDLKAWGDALAQAKLVLVRAGRKYNP